MVQLCNKEECKRVLFQDESKGSDLEFFHESFHRTSNDPGPVSIS
jgi:hypothetical protein